MKHTTYYKRDLTATPGRVVSIRETSSDKECDTVVRKDFIYLVRRVDEVPKDVPPPQVRVIKQINSQSQKESFRFRVKGDVYFRKGRFIYQVRYLHGLKIRMFWKTHVLSSDSAALA